MIPFYVVIFVNLEIFKNVRTVIALYVTRATRHCHWKERKNCVCSGIVVKGLY